jgi:hypothetical protein
MRNSGGIPLFHDLQDHTARRRDFFFLDRVLKARIALHLETGSHGDNDEDINVYMAGLLESVTKARGALTEKPYISPYDHDVRRFLDHHPEPSTRYVVYRDNADFGLVAITVFMGFDHKGSYHAKVLGRRDQTGRLALYYSMAAAALSRIRGPRVMLVHTFHMLAEHMDDVVRIMRTVAADYFDFIERLSGGSLYHLGRELDERSREEEYRRTLDRFLAGLGRYRHHPSEPLRRRLVALAGELRRLDPSFAFDDTTLAG